MAGRLMSWTNAFRMARSLNGGCVVLNSMKVVVCDLSLCSPMLPCPFTRPSCVPGIAEISTPLDSSSLMAVASLMMVLILTVVTYETPLFFTHDGAKLCRLLAVSTTVLKSPLVLLTVYAPEPTGRVQVLLACDWNHFLSRMPVYAPARLVSSGRFGAERSSSTVEL